MASVYRAFPEKLGGQSATSFVGNQGDLFYDPTTATLRVSDGSTAGGVVVGPRYKGTASFTNFTTSPEGTWTGTGITADYSAISSPTGYGTFQFTFTMDHDYGDTASYLLLAQAHHYAGESASSNRGAPYVVNMEKVNGTTFIGTVSDPTSATADDGKFDLFVFDA